MAAASADRATRTKLRCLFFDARSIIDFLEEVVVLLDLRVLRVERERLFVGCSCLDELSFVFVCHGQIVESGRVRRVDLDRLLPSVDGLAPQTSLGYVDP